MKKLNLPFVRIQDVKPKEGQEILYIDEDKFNGFVEIKYGVIEYCWFGIDETGLFTGEQIEYEPGVEELPKSEYKLKAMVGPEILPEDLWWCSSDTLLKKLK